MIRDYVSGDAQSVAVQCEQYDEARNFADFFDMITTYTLENERHQILAVFGYRIGIENEAECFALIGKNIGRNMLEFIRFLLREIPGIMNEKNISKAVMTVKKNFSAGVRLAGVLGFKYAAELPLFYCGKDYQLFERNKICL